MDGSQLILNLICQVLPNNTTLALHSVYKLGDDTKRLVVRLFNRAANIMSSSQFGVFDT